MIASITDLLGRLEPPGTFATRLRAPAHDLEIQVKGVGPLELPITARLAQKLRGVARPSPFGLREQTLHDPSVRSTWEVAASRVKIATRTWQPALTKYLGALQADLGFPEECTLQAKLDKLLIYEQGQFFKPHQDSEKADEMVGTLVVILPSRYRGGVVTVEHRGEKKRFRRVESQAKDLSLLAFYADCHHAVSSIESGVRVALTYQLALQSRSKAPLPSVRADAVERLAECMRKHFTVPVIKRYSRSEPAPPERLVYLLDHEYTQRSLSWSRLKNGDRVRVAALRAAAERTDCECCLALAEVHETWSCEDDELPYRYGFRRWRSRQDRDDDTHEPELIALEDSSISLRHWVDVKGQLVEGIGGSVSDEELCFTRPSRELDPFKSEHEGYQGNYGNTVDRWYHRAALVIWPRDMTFALRAQASPRWAVDQLLALPRGATAELESRVESLLRRWKHTAGRVDDARFFAKLVKLSTRLDAAALAHGWLLPLGAHRLRSRSVRRGFATAVAKHGLPWGKELFTAWVQAPTWETPGWSQLLPDICGDLRASGGEAGAALAQWLVERAAKATRDLCAAALRWQRPWLALDVFEDEAAHVAHVLAAALEISASEVIEETMAFFLDEKRRVPVSFFAQLLPACFARSAALRARMSGSALHRRCVEQLEAVLRAPARAPDDWTIAHALGCGCSDCKGLARFLRSSGTACDWPLNKERRRHIHDTIDAAKLPISHTTLRRGSPHVLQLRKDHSLFSREREHRARVKQVLNALPAVRGR